MLHAVLALVLLLAPIPAGAERATNDDIIVNVERRGERVLVEVEVPIAVRPEQAWPILTDYERMAQVFPDLVESKVIRRDGNTLRVHQRGRARRGPLWFSFENVRDIVLVPPTEIRTHLVRGTFKQADSVTHLVPTEVGMRLVNRGEYVPPDWIPVSLALPLVESEMRSQFGIMRAEILRRTGGLAASRR